MFDVSIKSIMLMSCEVGKHLKTPQKKALLFTQADWAHLCDSVKAHSTDTSGCFSQEFFSGQKQEELIFKRKVKIFLFV